MPPSIATSWNGHSKRATAPVDQIQPTRSPTSCSAGAESQVAGLAGTDFSATEALSTQIAYDVALIRYAQCLGMTVGSDEFDPPSQGRRVIERWTAERGIELP